jgi:hypothetical protein
MSELNRRHLLTALIGTCAGLSVVGVAATSAEAKPIAGGVPLPEAPATKSETHDLQDNVALRHRRRRRWIRGRWFYY